VLSIAAPGFTARHARAGTGDAPLVAWFVHQPGFGSGHRPIAGTPATNGALAGDRLRHPTSFLPPDEPCARTRRRAARGWVVVTQVPRPDYQRAAEAARACLAAIAYRVEVTPGVAVYAAG
jgi:hypothetical protein